MLLRAIAKNWALKKDFLASPHNVKYEMYLAQDTNQCLTPNNLLSNGVTTEMDIRLGIQCTQQHVYMCLYESDMECGAFKRASHLMQVSI